MSSKQSRSRSTSGALRSSRQTGGKGLGIKQYSLIIGIVVVAVVIVSAFAILGQGNTQRPPFDPGQISQDKSVGPPDAPVVVVEYADFQCPFCKQFATGAEVQLRQDYVDTGRVRYVFRHMAFIGPESMWAAQATECANEQERFWDYHDKLFEEQGGENQGVFSQDNLKRFAADLGLNTEQFNQCLDSGKYQTKVQEDISEAQRLGVRSTPTLFVNGQLVNNGSNYQTLQGAIEAVLP